MAQRTLNRRSRARDDDKYDEPDARREPDEEPPRRGRSRRDPEDEPEPPRSRRSRKDPDDADAEPPRGRRSSRRDPDEGDEPRSRRSRRDPDEDEPRSSRRSEREQRPKNSSKGWSGYKERREEVSDYIKNYLLPVEQEEIVKVLDAEPFSVFAEHWLNDKEGKKSYLCIGKEECPLCAIGDKARVYMMFNILDLRDDENPKISPWKVSQTVGDVLEGYAKSDRTSPIDRLDIYFSVQKTGGGKKGKVQTHISPVKARDLEEDWGIKPFTQDELDEFDLYKEDDVLEWTSRKTLKAIAEDLD